MTWDLLQADTARYGDDLLRTTIDTVKSRTMGTVVTPPNEVNYPMIVVDYLAKLTALELIAPGMDAWRINPISLTTTGTNEVVAYSDPIEALRELRKNLLEDTRKLKPLVDPLIDYIPLSNAPRAAINTLDEDFLTPSPQEFPRPYRITERT